MSTIEKSVFIYRKGALGDTLFFIPLLFYLRRYFSQIYFAGNYLYRDLFKGIDFITFLDADSKYVFDLLRGKENFLDFQRFYIFSKAFDKISDNFYCFNPLPQNEWVYKYPFQCLKLNFCEEHIYFPVFFNSTIFNQIKGKKFFLLHPGSGGKNKRWALKYFFQLERKLNNFNYSVYYLLGESESNLLQYFNDKKIFYNYSLNDIIFLIQYATGFIGNDSGVGHLAGLVGVGGVLLFGPTNLDIYSPFGSIKTIRISDDVNDIKPDNILEKIGESIEKR